MDVKKINKILGSGFFFVAILRIIVIVMIFTKMKLNYFDMRKIIELKETYYSQFYSGIKITELILSLALMVMIFVNIKKQSQTIPYYLLGIIIIITGLIWFIVFSSTNFYTEIFTAAIYMKIGIDIASIHTKMTTKKMLQKTDWFYNKDKEIK